jgi:hypothetical protein
MSTSDEKLELAKQWEWMHTKVASGDWPTGEEVRCNSHYLIFQTTSDELMACLYVSWQRCSVKPQNPSDA